MTAEAQKAALAAYDKAVGPTILDRIYTLHADFVGRSLKAPTSIVVGEDAAKELEAELRRVYREEPDGHRVEMMMGMRILRVSGNPDFIGVL